MHSIFFQNTFCLGTFTNRIHFGLSIIKYTQYKIRNAFYQGTFVFRNSFWSYHHYVHAVTEEGTGVATWPVETFIFLTIVFHTLYNQARDSDLKALTKFFVSSVRSSNSHPDLLLIHPPPPTFSVTHRSSILDFHFLSQCSYIIGNHWTHLLATCIPYGYNRTSLQDSAR